jgi:cytochrome o ubiquinol oxidase subunit 2
LCNTARRNGKGAYDPDWDFNWTLELLVWGMPVILVAVLGLGLWRVTHRLDPYSPITDAAPPLDIDVVMLDWKFLFLYPGQGIATVNRLVIPATRPVSFRLTSWDVMQSFIIPRLGGQIYTMPGMVTRLHLIADAPGPYQGENAQYNGRGFADQKFTTDAMTGEDFDAWVTKTKVDGKILDAAALAGLEKPSVQPDPIFYGRVDGNPFAAILAKFGMTPQMEAMP